jgi:hypothetical protein
VLGKLGRWLEDRWFAPWERARQQRRLLAYCPSFAPILAQFEAHYPEPGSAGLTSFLERQDRQIEADSLTYGETPFSTWIALLKHWKLSPEDTLIDLGGGSGLFSLLTHTATGANAISIDRIEAFASHGHQLVEQLDLQGVTFVCDDFCHVELSQGTHFYSTMTCFPDDLRAQLSAKLAEAPSGARIATVTFALESPFIHREAHWKHLFPWGWDDIFLHRRV